MYINSDVQKYTHADEQIDTCTHTCIHAHVEAPTHVWKHARFTLSTDTDRHGHRHRYIHTHTHLSRWAHTHTRTLTRTHARTLTRTHTRTHLSRWASTHIDTDTDRHRHTDTQTHTFYVEHSNAALRRCCISSRYFNSILPRNLNQKQRFVDTKDLYNTGLFV